MCARHTVLAIALSALLVSQWSCLHVSSYEYEAIREDYAPASIPEPAPTASDNGETALDLTAVIRRTWAANPRRRQALARVARAQAVLQESLSAYWPQIDAKVEYLQGESPSTYLFKRIDARKLPRNVDFNEPGWFENVETGLAVRWRLFAGGRRGLHTELSQTRVDIARQGEAAVRNALTNRAIDLFYAALAAREFIDIAEQSVETVQRQLNSTRTRFKGGAALKADVLSMEVRLAEAKRRLVSTEARANRVHSALAVVMGDDPGASLTLAKGPEWGASLPDTYSDGVVYALLHRPEVSAARKRVVRSRLALDAARSTYLPTVDAMARYYHDDPDMSYSSDRENWTAGVALNWKLFSGFSRRARVHQAEALIRKMLAADAETVDTVRLEVRNAYLNHDEAQARLSLAEASVEQAEEAFELVRTQYEGGAVTITRFLQAELARSSAHADVVAARSNLNRARADMGRALGFWSHTGAVHSMFGRRQDAEGASQ